MPKDLKCEVCGDPTHIVAASPLGPVSIAMCLWCIRADRQPWYVLVGGLMNLDRGDVADWVQPYIKATCAYYRKTEDELWEEIGETYQRYVESCQRKEGWNNDQGESP